MKNLYTLILLLGYSITVLSQNVGIGTNSANALLELYDSTSSGIKNVFLARSGYRKESYSQPIGTVLQVSNSGNVGIGSGYGGTGLVDIFGKMGDSVLLNLHGSPTMIFGGDAVLRFSGSSVNYFDVAAHFLENPYDNYLAIGKLRINRLGSLIVGGQPFFGSNANSLTINHNAGNESGLPLVLAEYASQTPVRVSFYTSPIEGRNWTMAAYAAATSDNSYVSFSSSSGTLGKPSILFKGNGKLGVNTAEVVSETQVQISGMNTPSSTPLLLSGVQEYADNTAAVAAGLPAGALYRTGDVLKIVH